MNVYLFELKAQARSFLAGTVVLAGVMAVLMIAVFPVYRDAKPQVEAVLAGFPPQFSAAFGLTGDLFGFGGFFAFGFLYFALIAAIFGASWGLAVFGREKRSKCTDFLLTKAPSRPRVFAAKLAACLSGVLASTLVFVGASAAVYLASGDTGSGADVGRVVGAAASIASVELVFMAAAVLLAVCARRVRSVSGAATAFGIVGFVLAALPQLTGEDALRALSPFSYFDPKEILLSGTVDAGYAALACALVLACLAIAFVRYCRMDVRAA